MPNEGATQFGSIKAVLTLDKSDYVAGLKAAGAQADELGRHDPTIHVETRGVPQAIAEMKSADAAVTKFHESTGRAGGRTRALVAAIALLGPALVPVGAAAIGLGVAFAGMGTAAVLAIVGIKREMQQGTKLGLEYTAAVDDLKGSIQALSTVAAGRFLASFQSAVRDLQQRTPVLTRQIGDLSSITGEAARAGVGGLVSAFITLNPLIVDGAMYVRDLAQRFERAMSGPGVVSFGDYVRSVFPQVMDALENIVAAAGHLVAALAPLGLGTLSMLSMFAQLLRGIPTEILGTVAQLATSVYLGFKTWQLLNGPINGLITLLGGVDAMSRRAAAGIRGLQIAAGVIGVALAAFSWIVSANAESQREAEEATNRYADALRASNGVINESIRLSTAKTLADQGILDAARQLGINLTDVTSAALGNADAMARVNAVIDANGQVWTKTVVAGKSAAVVKGELTDEAQKVREAIGFENAALDAGIQKNKDIAAATAENAGQTSMAAIAAQALANTYGVSTTVYQQVATSQQGIADKAAAARLQMQLENDAAGILKQTLDQLNGESLSAAEAQNAFESSLVNMGDHVDKTGKKITFTTTSITDMSSASVALRGQLNGQIANLQRVVEANGGLADSTGKARAQMVTMRQQIIDNAVAHGVDREAVTKYVDSILKIPKSVPPTKLDIDKAAAEQKLRDFQAHINGLKGKSVTVTTTYVTKGDISLQAARNRSAIADIQNRRAGGIIGLKDGGPIPGYASGTIVGPGTGTSDSILAMVRESGRLLRVSNGEFVSTAASTRANRAELEAANKGAKLSVAGKGGISADDLEVLLMKMLAEMRRKPLEATVTTGQFSQAIASRLPA